MRLAAIDIGSNAARLLISEVKMTPGGKPEFIKLNLVRVPLRLGFDVFEQGEISKERVQWLVETIKAYKHLLNIYQVEYVIACATSAMRDARNAPDIIRSVRAETGIEIKVITGQEEANVIYESHFAESLNKEDAYLYIDVGGGSTELTCFSNGRLEFKESFNIGTIRLLKKQVTDASWDEVKTFLRNRTKGFPHITAIGSGGNINKIFSLSKRKDGKPLHIELLKDYLKELSSFTVEERVRLYKLKEDRADVIVPALQIYINIMRWTNTEEIYVPKIGLVDGLIQHLYDEKYVKRLML
ncbi:Ppx/GppA phosphatase family protein [Dinghuibacter silviterrae]|uniref:Exopolyphosphatase/guanosine-5'-triphosphate, 3'-diphosphate pyrophosphatase n=1 Tax=Dinghuibacter silviterrae TaxID=1539049 RepID=A0A4R8DXE4_9BACT|nr:exopolyphosphatase [Dinghuibacter silviterrae]TDX02215.1 exopolyphosphatase/guanosine-5'-triphosphate,3'-diphosphate pyrophosphatase [Dinghuibacter silviterrae]